jgi:hypothetical protein
MVDLERCPRLVWKGPLAQTHRPPFHLVSCQRRADPLSANGALHTSLGQRPGNLIIRFAQAPTARLTAPIEQNEAASLHSVP